MSCTCFSITFLIKFKFSVFMSLFPFLSVYLQLPTSPLSIFMTSWICFWRAAEFNQDDLCVHMFGIITGAWRTSRCKTEEHSHCPDLEFVSSQFSHCLWKTRGTHCKEMTVFVCQSCLLKSYLEIVHEDSDRRLKLSVVCDDWILLGHKRFLQNRTILMVWRWISYFCDL